MTSICKHQVFSKAERTFEEIYLSISLPSVYHSLYQRQLSKKKPTFRRLNGTSLGVDQSNRLMELDYAVEEIY